MIFLLYYIELYTAFLLIYVVVMLFRKKKLHFLTFALNILVIGLFFYIRKKVFDEEWVLFGEYDPLGDVGESFHNFSIYIINIGMVLIAFCVIQIVFWKIFIKNNDRLTNDEQTRELLKTLGTQ